MTVFKLRGSFRISRVFGACVMLLGDLGTFLHGNDAPSGDGGTICIANNQADTVWIFVK
jgi:hypothetical protein